MDQGHKLLRNQLCCPGARSPRQTVGQKEGGESLGLAGGTAQQVLQLLGSACVQATICQSNHGLVGGFGPLRIGIQELLRTSHFGDADGPPCSLLPALQGLISGCLMARACCASAKCLCPVFLSCSPGSKGEGMLPCLGMKEAQVSALESKLTVDTFYLC